MMTQLARKIATHPIHFQCPACGYEACDPEHAVLQNAAALRSDTWHWCGDTLVWSPANGGCLMWLRNGRDWSSQDEGGFPTAQSAIDTLVWYERKGVAVAYPELDDTRTAYAHCEPCGDTHGGACEWDPDRYLGPL